MFQCLATLVLSERPDEILHISVAITARNHKLSHSGTAFMNDRTNIETNGTAAWVRLPREYAKTT
jgi:hypothetical protein